MTLVGTIGDSKTCSMCLGFGQTMPVIDLIIILGCQSDGASCCSIISICCETSSLSPIQGSVTILDVESATSEDIESSSIICSFDS